MKQWLLLFSIINILACSSNYKDIPAIISHPDSGNHSLPDSEIIEKLNQCSELQPVNGIPDITMKEFCFADLYCTEFNYTHLCFCEDYCTCFFSPGGITFLPLGYCELPIMDRILIHYLYSQDKQAFLEEGI